MSETLVERLNRHAAELDAEVDGLMMPGSRYAARMRQRAGDLQEGAARIAELEAEVAGGEAQSRSIGSWGEPAVAYRAMLAATPYVEEKNDG